MPDDEHDDAAWTVRAKDGIVHKAVHQHGWKNFVITLCPFWQTHNMSGEVAPVRVDEHPTCFECTEIMLRGTS